jgi:methyltransferase (TIGR00027 family)
MTGIANDADDLAIGLSSHLETHYKIQITKLVCVEPGVFRVDQAFNPSWIARVFPRHNPHAVTDAEPSARILFFLQQCGFSAERCAHEKPVSTFRVCEVLVTEFIHGDRPKLCSETFHRLGDLLGRLHTLPLDNGVISWRGGAWHHLANGGAQEEIAAALALILAGKPSIQIDEYAAYAELRGELERADSFKDLPEALVHPDFVPINVIELPDHSLVPIDWAGSGQGPRIFSLAWLLFAAGCNGTEMIEAVIAGYRPHILMENEELSHLSNSIFTRQLTIACWEVRNRGRTLSDIAREVPTMRNLAEKFARLATAAFAKDVSQARVGGVHGIATSSNVALQEVGQTGLYTAAVRAEESMRANRLFDDPLVQAFVSHWKYVPPSGQNSQRSEALRKFIVARTVFFDELILSACRSGCRQIVLLGAGMDTRAFRLPLPSNTCFFELDTADVLENKNQVLKGCPASSTCSRIIVPCDLRSDWLAKLKAAGFDTGRSTAWIVEGVLVYLEEDTVNDVVRAIGAMSASGSRMGLDMASHDQRESVPWRLKRSTAPFDPVIWLAEHGWNAEVSHTRDVLSAHGRIPRVSNPGKAEQASKPKAILIDAAIKL